MKDLVNEFLKYSFKGRIAKKDFEVKLEEQFGKGKVTREEYNDEFIDVFGEEITEKVTAYFVNGKHIGSFQRGKGFIYSKNYQKPKYLTSLAY